MYINEQFLDGLKNKFPENITWSVMGKQTANAKDFFSQLYFSGFDTKSASALNIDRSL